MKDTDLLWRQPVRFALLITALAGAFVVGKCSISDPPEETVPEVAPCPEQEKQVVEKAEVVKKGKVIEQEKQVVEKKEIVKDGEREGFFFDDQCQDVRPDIIGSESFLSLLENEWEMRIYGEPDEQEFSFPSFVLVKPERKKRRLVKQKYSPSSFVLVKPVRKKRRIAPLKKKVEKYVPRLFDKNTSYACKGTLIPALLATVADLEAKSIRYGIGPLSDCSGIIHRVLMGLQRRCPDNKYPDVRKCRDSRGLAGWYHRQGKLIRVKNAVAQSDLIRPGMVLFFGRTGVRYKNASVKTLLSPRHGIYHVGVVVRTYRDGKGKLTGYELFHGHGRRGKTKASVTKWHKRRPTRAGYPPFGNGRQQLVAMAQIVQFRKTAP
jgi:hypothetical protein